MIDLRWLRPLDFGSCRESVERTGRLVVAEEQYHLGGWASSLISHLTMAGVAWAAPPRAVSLPEDLLISYSPPLEDEIMPSAATIADAARLTVRGR